MKPRIAIIALTNQPDPSLGEPAIEVAEQLAAQATERLTALGAEIMQPVPICAARLHNTHCVNGEDTRRAVAQANAWPADCVILLRYVEIESAIRKALLVLKLRGSDHAKDIRQFEITNRGMEILSRFEGREGIMSGNPRRMAEAFDQAFRPRGGEKKV